VSEALLTWSSIPMLLRRIQRGIGKGGSTPQWQADNKNNLMQPEQDEEQTLRVSTAWLQVSQELAPTI